MLMRLRDLSCLFLAIQLLEPSHAADPLVARAANELRRTAPEGVVVRVDEKEQGTIDVVFRQRLVVAIEVQSSGSFEEYVRLCVDQAKNRREWYDLVDEVSRIPKEDGEFRPRNDQEREVLLKQEHFWETHQMVDFSDSYLGLGEIECVGGKKLNDIPKTELEAFERYLVRVARDLDNLEHAAAQEFIPAWSELAARPSAAVETRRGVFYESRCNILANIRFFIDASYDDFVAMPLWEPGKAEPAVLPNAAWQRAADALRALGAEPQNFDTDEVILDCIGTPDDYRFVYKVRFCEKHGSPPKKHFGTLDQVTIWVTTDGKVLPMSKQGARAEVEKPAEAAPKARPDGIRSIPARHLTDDDLSPGQSMSLLRFPAWRFGNSEPPVLPNEAWRLAWNAVQALGPSAKDYLTERIELRLVPGLTYSGVYQVQDERYHYSVEFRNPHAGSVSAGTSDLPNPLSVMVLLDGTVFLPRIDHLSGRWVEAPKPAAFTSQTDPSPSVAP